MHGKERHAKVHGTDRCNGRSHGTKGAAAFDITAVDIKLVRNIFSITKSLNHGNRLRITCIGLTACLFESQSPAKDGPICDITFINIIRMESVGHINAQHKPLCHILKKSLFRKVKSFIDTVQGIMKDK